MYSLHLNKYFFNLSNTIAISPQTTNNKSDFIKKKGCMILLQRFAREKKRLTKNLLISSTDLF